MGGRGSSSGAVLKAQLLQMKQTGNFPKMLPGNNFPKERAIALKTIADNWDIPDDLKNAKFTVNNDWEKSQLWMQTADSRIPGNAGKISLPDNLTKKEMQGLKVFLAQRYKRKQEK